MTYFRNSNGEIAIASHTNEDRVTYEPWTDGHSVGFRVIDCATGRVEIIKLTPSGSHDPGDNGTKADVFLYHQQSLAEDPDEDASPLCYVDLFWPEVAS